jgi:hypothetical protein
MPIRMMVWNIQTFGPGKLGRPTVMDALATIVYNANVDVLLVLELNSLAAIQNLSARLNAMASAAAGGAAVTTFSHCFFSQWSQTAAAPAGRQAHGEYYGVIIRDTGTVTIEGFAGPAGHDHAFVGTAAYGVLPASSVFAAPNFTNYLPLLPSVRSDARLRPGAGDYFLGGRPPCLFALNMLGARVAVLGVHTRPNQNTAIAQLEAMRANSPMGDRAAHVIVAGDLNIDYTQLFDRQVKRTQVMELVAKYLEDLRLDTMLRRNVTHINGSLYDNFLVRGIRCEAEIVLSSAALMLLSAAQVAALQNAANDRRGENYVAEMASCVRLGAMMAAGRSIAHELDDIKRVFILLSDHFPIVLTINRIG